MSNDDAQDKYQALGDPTEVALVVAASRLGLHKTRMEEDFVRVAELPFDCERKRMTTVHTFSPAVSAFASVIEPIRHQAPGQDPSSFVAFTKGAVDSLLGACSTVWVNGWCEPLDQEARTRILAAHDRLAQS